jgi:hypothetical protein
VLERADIADLCEHADRRERVDAAQPGDGVGPATPGGLIGQQAVEAVAQRLKPLDRRHQEPTECRSASAPLGRSLRSFVACATTIRSSLATRST